MAIPGCTHCTGHAQSYWGVEQYDRWQVGNLREINIHTGKGLGYEVRGGVLASVYLQPGASFLIPPSRTVAPDGLQ